MCEIWREHATWVQLPMMSLLSVSSSPLPLNVAKNEIKVLGVETNMLFLQKNKHVINLIIT